MSKSCPAVNPAATISSNLRVRHCWQKQCCKCTPLYRICAKRIWFAIALFVFIYVVVFLWFMKNIITNIYLSYIWRHTNIILWRRKVSVSNINFRTSNFNQNNWRHIQIYSAHTYIDTHTHTQINFSCVSASFMFAGPWNVQFLLFSREKEKNIKEYLRVGRVV